MTSSSTALFLLSRFLTFSSQNALVLLTELSLRQDKALGSETVEWVLMWEKEHSSAGALLSMIGFNFGIKVGRAALE
jgi:hypothetical protein